MKSSGDLTWYVLWSRIATSIVSTWAQPFLGLRWKETEESPILHHISMFTPWTMISPPEPGLCLLIRWPACLASAALTLQCVHRSDRWGVNKGVLSINRSINKGVQIFENTLFFTDLTWNRSLEMISNINTNHLNAMKQLLWFYFLTNHVNSSIDRWHNKIKLKRSTIPRLWTKSYFVNIKVKALMKHPVVPFEPKF